MTPNEEDGVLSACMHIDTPCQQIMAGKHDNIKEGKHAHFLRDANAAYMPIVGIQGYYCFMDELSQLFSVQARNY